MTLTDDQYERIARRLDGEDIPLTAAEQRIADELVEDEGAVGARLSADAAGLSPTMLAEVRRDEAAVGPRLDVPLPSRAFDRAQRRLAAELARPRRRLIWAGSAAGAVAAAAAALLIAALAGLWQPVERDGATDGLAVGDGHVPVEVISESVGRQPEEVAFDLIEAELAELEADALAAAPAMPVDTRLDDIERALEEFWLDDPIE